MNRDNNGDPFIMDEIVRDLGSTIEEAIEGLAKLTGDYWKEHKMNDKQRENFGKDLIQMYDSLHKAVQAAGGTGGMFSAEGIESHTVLEMMSHCAPNGIRFYCAKTHALVEHPRQSIDPRYHKKGSGDLKEESEK